MNPLPIIVEQRIAASPEQVWKAISDRDEMKHWYFELEKFNAEPGFAFQFYGGPSPEKQYLHICEVVEAIPGTKLSYTWRYDGYEGNSLVCFDLIPTENQTLVRLSHEGLATLPQDNPDFALKNFEAGWNEIIKNLLKTYLEK